jgi:hypothetical protein
LQIIELSPEDLSPTVANSSIVNGRVRAVVVAPQLFA